MKTRASTVAGLLENYQVIDEVIESAKNSNGSALQENESTNYVIGVMSDSLDYDDLPQL